MLCRNGWWLGRNGGGRRAIQQLLGPPVLSLLPPDEQQYQRQQYDYYHELTYRESGDPVNVLKYNQSDLKLFTTKEQTSSSSSSDQTVIAFLAAPWNPADAMMVEGRYPQSAASSIFYRQDGKIAGSEGWGQVVNVSKQDAAYWAAGDYVVPGRPGLGTMRSHCIVEELTMQQEQMIAHQEQPQPVPTNELFIKLERGDELMAKCGLFEPAALFQTGGTAWRMIQDFVPIQPGETLIQNAGNSAVGWMVSQMAASLGARPVSLVRRGLRTKEQNDRLVEELKTNGKNELVLFEEDMTEGSIKTTLWQDVLAQHGLELPRLALNGIGGRSAAALLASLAESGTMVTYGGMSKKPFYASAYHLIFRDIKLLGYWQSRWMVHSSTIEQRRQFVNQLVDMVLNGTIVPPPTKVFQLPSFRRGLEWDQSTETIRQKIVFDCREGM